MAHAHITIRPISKLATTRSLMATTALASTSLIMAGVLNLASAQSLPTGGSVAAGNVTINQTAPNRLVINQMSGTAVTNWQSFSIGAGNSVAVVQPSTSASMLARVTGTTTSTISGSLTATGQLILVNPNGIAITPKGTVNTASGFIATSLGISDSEYLAGKRIFSGNGASADVSNAGTITVGRGGYAALIGGTVSNSGTISVPMGKVGLGSGEVATLDFSGDGFLQVGVPTNAPGTGALVSNSGRIVANGGNVQLKAAAARDAARAAINMSGVIAARSISGTDGNITLDGGNGSVAVSGKLNASSRKAKGGTITVTGRDVRLTGARLNVSGKTGGGTVRIGGDRQGKGTLAHATTTTIDAATTIKADATSIGNGGSVVVWSDSKTDFAGSISAQGGATGGDGGAAEVSSHGVLGYTGTTVLTAPHGATGTLLLDPENVTISTGFNTSGFTASVDNSIINVTTLQNALATANVTVSTGSGGSQTGDITIAVPLSWSANTLTLDAYHSINIYAPVTVTGTGGLTLKTNDGGTGGDFSFGLTGSGFTGRVDFTGTPATQALTINGMAYTLLYSMADVANVNTTGLTGNYALAGSLDASGTTYTTGVIAGGLPNNAAHTPFSGTFEGLGHTIANLTINGGSNADVGLFGYATGTLRDIGVTGGSFSGPYKVGGLVAYKEGGAITNAYSTGNVSGDYLVGGLVGYAYYSTISNAYATGAIIGTGTGSSVGGLVGGQYSGTLNKVYATGAVSAGGWQVGGLVGDAEFGTISNAYATGTVSGGEHVGGFAGYVYEALSNVYATGAVTGTGYNVGGLVGTLAGTISNAYATGTVSGLGSVGGLVGYQYADTVTNSYWDKSTSGLAIGVGSGGTTGVTGLTTAQLQNGSSALGLGAAFTVTSGLYPYLTSFYPNGVQAISGTAYTDRGVTPLASGANGAGLVNVRVGTGTVQTVTTGANGYYYAIVPAGTIDTTTGTNVLVYTQANTNTGAANGTAFQTAATGSVSHFDISAGWRRDTTGLSTLSALDNAYATSIADTAASGFSLADRSINATHDFSLDTALSVTGVLGLYSPGNLTQTAALSASALYADGGTVSLTNAGNQFSTLSGGGDVNIYDASSLTIAAGAMDACNCTSVGVVIGHIKIMTAGDLTIGAGAVVYGTSPVLSAGGAFINNAGSSAVTATSGAWRIYSANPTGNTFGGLDSGNTAVWNTAAGGTVSATGNRYVFAYQPMLTVTANDASKIYGNAATLAGATITGVQAGVAGAYLGDTLADIVSGAATVASTGAAATAGVNTYAITATQGSLMSASYGLTFVDGTLTVGTRALTVTADAKSQVYGNATPTLTYTVGGLGLVNGDTLSGSLATSATSTSPVGSYAITQGSLGNANYAITYTGANDVIGQRALAVTADAKSQVYGNATPTLTYSVGGLGLVNGDTLSGALATSATSTSSVGSYAITQGSLSASSNYAITYTGANDVIGQRALTVTADAKSQVYGNATPTLTYSVGGLGLVNGDTLSGSLATSATSTSSVGSYAITQGSLSASSNYAITYTGANDIIGQRALTVTADAKTQIYGNATPALTYTIGGSGLVNGDTLSGSLATSATSTSSIGSYAITQGSLSASSNYAITYTGANDIIGQRALAVTADAKTQMYGNATPTLTYTVGGLGLVNGDALSGNLATSATATSSVGSYAITQGSLGNANYAISYTGANNIIGQRAITVTADAKTQVFGNAAPTLTYTIGGLGLVNGDALTGSLATSATATSSVGSYAITQGSLGNANYAITYAGANDVIGQRAITVTADAKM